MRTAIIFLSIAMTGCFGTKKAEHADKEIDYFNKKKECSQLSEKFKAGLEAENEKATKYLHINRAKAQAFTVVFFESVCYSKAFNSCVAIVQKSYRVLPKKGEFIERVTAKAAIDILTNEDIGLVFDKKSEEGKYVDNTDYFEETGRLFNRIDCAK